MKSALSTATTSIAFALAAVACEPPPRVAAPPPPPAVSTPPTPPPAAQAPRLDAIPRLDFNQTAATLALPLFWIADRNGSGSVDPDEVAALWGATEAPRWTEGGAFTPAFFAAYEAMMKVRTTGYPRAGLAEVETHRRDAVLLELAQGRPSLLRSDFRGATAKERAIVGHMIKIAALIERIHARQLGTAGMAAGLPADDPASRALFWRNQGPWCEQPKTGKDPECSALPGKPPRITGAYPARVQQDPKFCDALQARPDQKTLMSPFTVVVEEGGELKTTPYNVAYKPEMEEISRELKAAADAVESPGEAPFKAYLLAASQAFLDNRWELADEAWAKMSVDNSKWYLRVGPDEVYWEPCSRKAGFHLSFALINQESLTWQKKLGPVRSEMEGAFAKLAGPPYKARDVKFHLPDFIDVVLNAGDSRSATGGTAGQSLPNWGPVANEGRGRTVAMVNLLEDDDSREDKRQVGESVLCKAAMDGLSTDPQSATLGTVLHEAAHNLGPAHEYKVKGKVDGEIFSGPLASMLEELKAQTGALYFTGWLASKGVIDAKVARTSEVRDILWAFRHIGQGMYTAGGDSKPYGQLASIQIGSLIDAGAIRWRADETAANGKDKGCFSIEAEKMPAAIDALARTVLGIKARGDKAGALRLRELYVVKDGPWKSLRAVIEERMLRMPLGSVVYAIEL